MDFWQYLLKPSIGNFQTFNNYLNNQEEVDYLNNRFSESSYRFSQTVVSGKQGSGVTHLLHALCNKLISKGKNVLYTTGQSIIHILKRIGSEGELKKFQNYLLSFELVAIDNIQFFYKKAVRFTHFISDLIQKFKPLQKSLFLGCSNPAKDFTKSKKYLNVLSLQRIELKTLGSSTIFRILKNLCEYEELIPERLLYVISGFNGSIQQYINCLVSIRFKSKIEGIDLTALSPGEIEKKFRIENYFPKQQFRKCFKVQEYLLWDEHKNPRLQFPIPQA